MASPGSLASTIRSTLAVGVADDAAVAAGSSSSVVITVAAGAGVAVGVDQARDDLGGDQRVVAGEDEDRLAVADHLERGAQRAAGAVGLAAGPRSRCPSGRPGERSRSGETITQTRPAPASRAARIGQATIGRPQTSCRTLGSDERIRVPSPAAMIKAVGALTPES